MTTAIIDGDVLIFQAAEASERIFDWGDDLWSIAADLREAQGRLRVAIEEVTRNCGAETWELCVSDGNGTFRHQLWPEYKGNRKKRKPLVFRALRDWAVRELGALSLPGLEGDDVMGIVATNLSHPDRTVLVTIDKDLKGIPGYHWNPMHPELGVVAVAPEEADRWHLIQTVAGDSTDGYSGVPGLGPVKAARLLDAEGATWETVVKAYASKGLTEAEALLNARLAKILTSENWDAQNQRVILWSPKKK